MNTNLTPTAIDELTVTDLAAFSAADLSLLQALVGQDARTAKARADKLSAALEARYRDSARAAYLGAGKDTGTIHLDDAGADVEVVIDKKVKWHQDKLASVLDAMSPELAKHYAKAEFCIPEAKFLNAPPDIRSALAVARTVETGRMKITIKMREAA